MLLVVGGAEVAKGGVPAARDKASMNANTAWPRTARVGQVDRSSSSVCSVARKLSATLLSKQSPMLPIDASRPASRRRWPNAQLV